MIPARPDRDGAAGAGPFPPLSISTMALSEIKRGRNGARSLNAGLVAQLTAEIALLQPKTGNTFAVADLPAAASNVGRVVYVTNGSAGSPCAAISNGTAWKVIALGATVSAT